jgi:hypothetical protein
MELLPSKEAKMRALGAVALTAASFICLGNTVAQDAGDGRRAGEDAKAPRYVDGAKNPELLPEPVVWDNVFAALHDFMSGTNAEGFAKTNLFISSQDAQLLKRGVERARLAVRERQDQLNAASRADAPPSEIVDLRGAVDKATLDGRDDILRSLSPLGAKALLRWVAVIKYGMSHEEPTP